MAWTIQKQLTGAFGALALIAVASTSAILAMVAMDRLDRDRVTHLRGIVNTLSAASFPLHPQVLSQIQGMTRSECVALNSSGKIVAATLPMSTTEASHLLQQALPLDQVTRVSALPGFQRGHESWRVAVIPLRSPLEVSSLLVLDPDLPRRLAIREAAYWPLLIGLGVGAAAVISAIWLARGFSQRVRTVQQHLNQLGHRDYVQHQPHGPHDELYDLQQRVNELAQRLAGLEEELTRTERMHVLSRLAAGLAHQIRNALTGARMAVQIHQRRCSPAEGEESLQIALRQLALTEHQLQTLVTVAAGEAPRAVPGDLREILDDVLALTQPYRQHQRTPCDVQCDITRGDWPVADAEALRTAVLNLLTNALEAAGHGGQVRCEVTPFPERVEIRILDNGPGVAPEIAPRLFDPLTTSKPEGMGLGLAYARQRIVSEGGQLDWSRADGWTTFRIVLPRSATPEK